MTGMEQHIEWTSPTALWDDFNGHTNETQRRVFRTPAILRFATDSFMQQFIDLMHADPHRMRQFLAVPEQWNKRPAEPEAPKRLTGLPGALNRARVAAVRRLEARQGIVRSTQWNTHTEQPLKLYQPAHQRYYLVTACLVCRTLGLPDRPLNTSAQEKVTFVIRMLRPRDGSVNPDPLLCDEFALVGDEWKPLSDPRSLAAGEEQHLLSPLTYEETDGRRRRLFNGLIPVAKREALVQAKLPEAPNAPPLPTIDPRQMLLKSQVIVPWSSLEEVAANAKQQVSTTGDPPTFNQKQDVLRRANEQIQTVAWYILLDFSLWLETNLKEVWDAITNNSSAGLSGQKLDAWNALGNLSSDGIGLRNALGQIRTFRSQLENVKSVFRAATAADWPSLKFQFITATESGATGLTGTDRRKTLEDALVAALDQQVPGTLPVPAASQVNAMTHTTSWFTVRCVFERPNCGGLAPAVVSDPSASFQLASFFDPDAPARPIRVNMPADTTPAGLRKFEKNTAFVMSDVLCGQMNAIRGLSFADLVLSVLPFPFHQGLNTGGMKPCTDGDGGPSIGLVCSFSIPIITICALILLMIMVKLLDMIFYWLPFFLICLPVPKFDAKSGG